ncbi:Neuroligin-2, partial [Atta colombica]
DFPINLTEDCRSSLICGSRAKRKLRRSKDRDGEEFIVTLISKTHCVNSHKNLRKYPVMMFIHGESFEWNSGNPYDGTILAAYGNIVFVTINFRLGILGFLRPGIRDDTASNFGLLDQIAALLWLRENIAEFGGDPNSVTLVGHGTGAIFANLLLISPVANKKGLFKRAILMSGSAMSADAIGKAPLQITKQVKKDATA